jgi:hypothetical protein
MLNYKKEDGKTVLLIAKAIKSLPLGRLGRASWIFGWGFLSKK